MIEKPKIGTAEAPTLSKKDVSDFSVSSDVQRIMGMKSNPEGFNPEVNSVPIPDPSARSYAARITERAASKKTAASLKGKSPPFGHVEPPPSEKMEAIAGLSGMARPDFSTAPPARQEEEAPSQPAAPQPSAVRGVGAAYPVNQALSQGKTDGPVTLKEGNKMAQQQTFSKETVQALEMANQNLKKPTDKAPEPEAAEKAPPSVAKAVREELDEAEQSLGPIKQIDFSSIADVRNTLMGQKRRDDIEARLKPLDIGDMVMKRELTQTVPVLPGKLEVTLRTFTQRENLWTLKYIFDFPGSSAYVQEVLNTCRLTCSVVALNGSLFPDHRKDVGLATEGVDKEAFERKMFHIASLPVQLVADLSIQSIWFQDRVDGLFTVDSIKNG